MIFLFLTMESQNQVIQFTLYNLYVIKQFSYEFFVMINLPFLNFFVKCNSIATAYSTSRSIIVNRLIDGKSK